MENNKKADENPLQQFNFNLSRNLANTDKIVQQEVDKKMKKYLEIHKKHEISSSIPPAFVSVKPKIPISNSINPAPIIIAKNNRDNKISDSKFTFGNYLTLLLAMIIFILIAIVVLYSLSFWMIR